MAIAAFEKVSYEQFEKDWLKQFPEDGDIVREIYDGIVIPKRATKGSAGYDFMCPKDLSVKVKESMLIPTGIRARIDDGYVLVLFPRSSMGFKYRMQLDNTAGIIDADYYGADNEGHIMCRITCDSNEGKDLPLVQGKGFVQGIFLPFGIAEEDESTGVRTGGFGSTDEKKEQ